MATYQQCRDELNCFEWQYKWVQIIWDYAG